MPATVIVGAQWGDEGKGKIVDLLAQDSDVVCRYQGGPNAGHTIVVDDETYKIRALPSGIVRGKPCVIGNGCVVDPEVLIGELDEFESRGHSTAEVYLSGNAHLIMPWHLAIDQASERRLGKLAIGTTKRGIGPCYADKAMRLGIRVQDLLDPKILRQKIEVALAEKNLWLERVYETRAVRPRDGRGAVRGLRAAAAPVRRRHVALRRPGAARRQAVLFEGAQATLLDLDHGTYPFVTSSNPVAAGAAAGVGIGPPRIDHVIGVAKAYVTRVGEGPFPTEIEGPDQDEMRELGHEFGTVTGRARRCGWLDLVALRYAVRVNGIDQLALTKLDVLSHFDEMPVCVRYRLRDGERDARLPRAPERLPRGRAGVRGAAGLERAARRLRDRGRSAGRGARATSTSSSASSASTCRSSAPAPIARIRADARRVAAAVSAKARRAAELSMHLVAGPGAPLVVERSEPGAGRPDLARHRAPELVESGYPAVTSSSAVSTAPSGASRSRSSRCPVAAWLEPPRRPDGVRRPLDRGEHLMLLHAPHADGDGAATRAISATPRGASAMNATTSCASATSKAPSSNGSSSAGAWWTSSNR